MMRGGNSPTHWSKMIETGGEEGDLTILDVGCGTGRATISVTQTFHSARVIGIDIFHGASGNSPEQVQKNAQIEGVGDRVEIQHGNLLHIPFPESTFDVVTSSSVLHDVHDDSDKVKAVQKLPVS